MKIFQVLCGKTWGGGSVVVHAITKALIARGDEVWVFSFDEESDRRFGEIGAKLARPPVWVDEISPQDARSFYYLWQLCRKQKFDLVATHTSKGGFLGRLAARLAGVPLIVHHAHGFAFNKDLSPQARRFYVMLEKFAARANDLIISVNEEQRKLAIKLGVETPDRIRTVHNGIDIAPFTSLNRSRKRSELGFNSDAVLIGTVGRLAPQKGLAYLIPAFEKLAAKFPAVHLIIAGDGPLQDDLKQQARMSNARNRIQFLGFRTDTPDLLAAYDIYAQPSLWEGHSISLIEALAAGKPIVATDIDGNREAVDPGETGLLVPPADSEALAAALDSLVSDGELANRLGKRAREVATERFTQDRMVQENIAAYDSVISRHAVLGRRFSPAAQTVGVLKDKQS